MLDKVVEEKINKIDLNKIDEKEVAIKINNENTIDLQNTDGMNYLKTVENNSINYENIITSAYKRNSNYIKTKTRKKELKNYK